MNRTRGKEANVNDTKPEDVLEKTYRGEDFVRVKAEFDEYIRIKEEKEGLLVFRDWVGDDLLFDFNLIYIKKQ